MSDETKRTTPYTRAELVALEQDHGPHAESMLDLYAIFATVEEVERLRAELAKVDEEHAYVFFEQRKAILDFHAQRDAALARLATVERERDEARAELAHEREHLAAVMRDANEARAELAKVATLAEQRKTELESLTLYKDRLIQQQTNRLAVCSANEALAILEKEEP